jgi:hypothetical protein
MTVGIIAEDDSDVAVIKEITLKILKPHRVGFKKFVGDGCGKLRRKCAAWAANLVQQGCRWLVVVHDLDTNNEAKLRAHLAGAISPAGAEQHVVMIPRREIEAWLLYDGDAIAGAFRESRRPKLPSDPESLDDPKKHLRNLVWTSYRKDYANTVHNAQIARNIDLCYLKGSRSFAPYPIFSDAVRSALAAEFLAPAARSRRRRSIRHAAK